MIRIGQTNTLQIASFAPMGAYLEPIQDRKFRTNQVLLPKREVPENSVEGDAIEVFVYKDSEDRPIATTQTPLAKVGEFTSLVVAQENSMGAFLDWGLPKDLFLPYKEQKIPVMAGKPTVVYVYLDDVSTRIVASSNYSKFLSQEPAKYTSEQAVELLITQETPMGFKAIINQAHTGLLLRENIITDVHIGDRISGFVSYVHPDGKIDLLQQQTGLARVEAKRETLLQLLQNNQGFLPLHDKSSPETIKQQLGISKKTFKKLTGTLYQEKLITIDKTGIKLV